MNHHPLWRRKSLSLCVALFTPLLPTLLPAQALAQQATLDTITVTARLREEDQQKIPVSVTTVDARLLESTFTDNVAGISRLVPSLGYVSPNPRNTVFNIRGLGASVVAISQANDGLEPGVGFYVDGVYHAKPATASFDFTDLERVEVLRGPQGTLFGKNTTAGAINLVSRAPSFEKELNAEVSTGDYGWMQGKFSVGGGLSNSVAGRFSVLKTRRDGNIHNVKTGVDHNDIDNDAVRGQLLFKPSEALQFRLIGDYSRIDNNCCTQVFAKVGATLKPANKQYAALAAGKNYAPPSWNPYDRVTDIDAQLAVDTSEGGIALTGDWKPAFGTFTSISSWRFWNWDAANDRDYTGLVIQTFQHIPSRQDQYSQELRFTSNPGKVDYVAGLYFFTQTVEGEPITIYGPAATYWLLGPTTLPDSLLNGYGTDGYFRYEVNSYAAYGEATWQLTDKLALTGGLRYTTEDKDGSYTTTVSGGLATTVTAEVNGKLSILRPQSYAATLDESNTTGRASASYQWTDNVMSYASYSKGGKAGGINMAGLPLTASNLPALQYATIRPERNSTYELGLKTRLLDNRVLLNAAVYDTKVTDYQANVVDSGPGALRGYLANIDAVTVKGAEIDLLAQVTSHLSLRASYNYVDGKFRSYPNGPCPLEKIGNSTTACDLSGMPLSSTPKNVLSVSGEYSQPLAFGGQAGEAWVRFDANKRGQVYGDPADSQATLLEGYTVVSASLGWRQQGGPWEAVLWARNLFDSEYMQNYTIQAGNSGLVLGTPGDARSYGVTVRVKY